MSWWIGSARLHVRGPNHWTQQHDALAHLCWTAIPAGYRFHPKIPSKVPRSGIIAIDDLLAKHQAIRLSYDDYRLIRQQSSAKIQRLLPTQCFLMVDLQTFVLHFDQQRLLRLLLMR